MTVDPRNFLFSSDYPMDKVVYLHSGVLNFAVSGTDYIVAHGLSFTPLIKVVWSTDANFTTTYGVGDGPVSTSPSQPFSPSLAYANANGTNITLSFGYPGAVSSVYIRVYAFMPSDVNLDIAFTASAADTFVLNTDYNYTKLFVTGVTASSAVASSAEVVSHSLGYYPQTEVWFERGGYAWVAPQMLVVNGVTRSTETFELTTSSLTMYRDPFLSGSERFHYRIYVDEL